MATKDKTANTLKTRQMTICNKGFVRENGRYVQFPLITLSGKWLKEHGFKAGQVIDIAYEEECKLVITIAELQRFEGI